MVDGTVTEFTVEAPVDGPYAIVVAGQNAKGRIHVDVDKVPASTEPAATPEPSNSAVEEESLPAEVPTRESTDTSVSMAPPVQEHNNPDAVTADDLVGSWHLAGDEKDNAIAIEAIPGAMEFGSGMEITSDGHISWYIVRRHIVGGANRTLISVLSPLRLCRTGTCRRLQTG